MEGNTIAIIVSVVSVVAVGATVGIGLATLILPALREMRREIADLRERMARLEGLFEGFTRRGGPGPPADASASTPLAGGAL